MRPVGGDPNERAPRPTGDQERRERTASAWREAQDARLTLNPGQRATLVEFEGGSRCEIGGPAIDPSITLYLLSRTQDQNTATLLAVLPGPMPPGRWFARTETGKVARYRIEAQNTGPAQITISARITTAVRD